MFTLSGYGYVVNVSGRILGHGRGQGRHGGGGEGRTREVAAGATVAADPGPEDTGTAGADLRVAARVPEGQGLHLRDQGQRVNQQTGTDTTTQRATFINCNEAFL